MSQEKYKIAILGAGNGGMAFAGYLSQKGHSIRLWNRTPERILSLYKNKQITLTGAFSSRSTIDLVTASISEAINGADIILITTTSDAHRELAIALTNLLEDGQIILLNPGRTGGALEVRAVFNQMGCKTRVYVAEAQSLVFACRLQAQNSVHIIGVKDFVPVAALPATDTEYVLSKIKDLFTCFKAAPNVLNTSLENIGAIFHPAVVMLNAATIDRGESFYFYQDMSPAVANFLTAVDEERLDLGKAFGIELTSIFDWIKVAYPECGGETLTERMRNNPAYFEIKAPTSLSSRLILEDIPMGLVPLTKLGQLAGLKMPLMHSIINIVSTLINRNLEQEGRDLEKLNLHGKRIPDIIKYVSI